MNKMDRLFWALKIAYFVEVPVGLVILVGAIFGWKAALLTALPLALIPTILWWVKRRRESTRNKATLQEFLLRKLPLGEIFKIPPRDKALRRICELLSEADFYVPPEVVLTIWEELSPMAQEGLSLYNDRESLREFCKRQVAPEVVEWLEGAVLLKG